MANRYANLVGSNKIKDEWQKINTGFDLVQQDVDQLQADLAREIADREAAVEYVDQRVDNIIVGGGPDKDPELVDIRTPDPSYTPQREINVAGDVTRDMQGQFVEFKDSITKDQVITYYVSPDGDDNNDGSISAPFATLQKAIDMLDANAYRLGMGNWKIKIASGTYDGAVINKAMHPKNRILIEGEVDESGVPTVIIDGTSSALDSGLAIGITNYVTVKDIKFTNWTKSSTSCGLVASNGVNLYAINVHANNITWAGININYNSRLYVEGGVIENCGVGIRVYGNCGFTIGYRGSTVKRITIKNCDIGIELRDASQGHIDYTDIDSCRVGIYCYNQSRFHLMGSSITNCTQYGVHINTSGTWYNNVVEAPNVFSGNAKDEIRMGYGTELTESKRIIYYPDRNQYIYMADDDALNVGHTSCRMVLSASGENGLNIISGDNNSAFLYFGTNTVTPKHGFLVSNTGNYMDFRVNTVNVVRLEPTRFRPTTDNDKQLGQASYRWSEVFSGTGVINTSDQRDKQQISDIPDAVLDAWAEVKYYRYKFNDAVEQKGEAARWHVGVIAQEIKEAFERHGLDATEYGLICYDEWDDIYEMDENGNQVLVKPAGSRWSIRPDECQFLEMALMRREIERLKGNTT